MLLVCLVLLIACIPLSFVYPKTYSSLPSTPSYWMESLNKVQYDHKAVTQVAFGCVEEQPSVTILNPYEYIRVYNSGLYLIVAIDAQAQEDEIVKVKCNVSVVDVGCVGHTYKLMYASVQASLVNIVEMYQKPVILVGHSIGGVLAQVAAYDLLSRNIKVHQVVTFGSPPAGSREFNDWVCTRTRCKRHQNMYDPVLYLSEPVFQYYEGETIIVGQLQPSHQLDTLHQKPLLSREHTEYYGFKRC